ncbi:long-chain-fatty-acid--CoA ligase [Spongiibacter sp. KMU-166]|uniref:Long-chain-fatty-acid--CoA ligase n=1 Tax=Spongiibacter thalassae TaxID=2721624 RepID=A0ABX1GLC4_9GAMM|nr:long-chain-fatty-acid--CoA ligase [Spongiibacter thalassae]NKI19237.1 long-chain-fatty-acid--CoA ligase [Spongiibacter thalassae]
MFDTLLDVLAFQAEMRPTMLFAKDDQQSLTHREAWLRIGQIAARLQASGVQREDRVGILCKNSVDNLLLFLGCGAAGVVPVAINYRLSAAEVAVISNDAEVVGFFHDSEFQTLLPDLNGGGAFVAAIYDDDEPLLLNKWLGGIAPICPVSVHGDDVFVQMYTSGTTGVPKGALISHRGVVTNAFQSILTHGQSIRAGDRGLMIAPSFHAVGLVGSLWTVMFGGGLVIHRDFNPVAMLEAIGRERITLMSAVPVMLQFALAVPNVRDYDFSSLEFISYGASPMSPDLLKQCLEVFDCKFAHGYGQTEATTALTFLPPEGHQRALADKPELLKSCGRAVYGSEIKIIDEQGNSLPVGEIGEILARGPQIMKGYWKRDEATASTIVDGWLHTGDAGCLDDEGYLFIKDRVKDMIISGGENIYPAEIEALLLGHPAIADVAVIGVPDEKWGEVPLAVLVAKGEELDITALTDFCRGSLASFKLPKKLVYVEALPRNPSGKVLKKDLRVQFSGA